MSARAPKHLPPPTPPSNTEELAAAISEILEEENPAIDWSGTVSEMIRGPIAQFLIVRTGAPRAQGSIAGTVVIEASSAMPGKPFDWVLTVQWPNGAETVEHCSTEVAALLGYVPEEGP